MGYRPQKLIGDDEKNLKLSREIRELKETIARNESFLGTLYETIFALKLTLNRVQNETRNNELISEIMGHYEAKVNEIFELKSEMQKLEKSIRQNEDILLSELKKSVSEMQPNNN